MTNETYSEIQGIARGVAHLIPNIRDMADSAVSEGWTPQQFRAYILDRLPSAAPVMRPAVAEVPARDMGRYSILKMVRSLVENRPVDGLEKEVSDELTRQTGMQPRGTWLPWAALLPKRDNLFVTGSIGGNISPINLLSSEYIDALRNRLLVVQMGARVLTGLQGTVILPKLTTASALTVKTEGQAYATSTPVFGQVTLSPKIVPGLVRFSKLLAVQSSPAVEQLVRDDLVKQINTEVDRQCLHGAGSGGEATGIDATTSVNLIATVEAGAAPSYTLAVSLETELAQDNADVGNLGYLTNSKVRGKLKETLENTVAGANYVWRINPANPTGLAMVNGYAAGCTNQVKSSYTIGSLQGSSAMFFGNWNDLLLGYFGGGIDLTVDPYSVPGWINLHGQQYFDVAVRHPQSFSLIKHLIA